MAPEGRAWWRDAAVLQVYPRSFQDSDGDGEGDLPGLLRRLDHVEALGVDAVWLSPIHPSPMADGGYDVADYLGVDPRFGTVADVEALADALHARGMRLLLDVVPCHTSIEHPWFRERPEFYVWSDRDGPQNNWRASFGGGAWSPDPHGRGWYLHSFYPEQPDLDWRNEQVREAFADVLRTWRSRGVDGFRLDAIDRLMKDPQRRDDPVADLPPPLPLHPEHATLHHARSRAQPDVGVALEALREGAGADAFLVGEVYLPGHEHDRYLDHVDATFSFDLLHARWNADALRAAIDAAPRGRSAWVLSNHDFPRLATRVGVDHARAATLLLLTLPGPAFLFQGDELGVANGPGRTPPDDRFGRDAFRHPHAWEAGAHGGFTTGEPWLAVVVAPEGPAAVQARRSDSFLAFVRDMLRLRRGLCGELEWVEAEEGMLAFRRGDALVAINTDRRPRPAPPAGPVLRATSNELLGPRRRPPAILPPGGGFLALAFEPHGAG